jgi:Flp pilus assembly protein TadD
MTALMTALATASPARADDLADADAALAAGEADGAERLYAKLADEGSRVARVYRNLATLYDTAGRGGAYIERAESLYRKAIELDPKDAAAHHGLGLHLYRQGKGADAIDPLRRAVQLDARNADARFWLARLLDKHRGGDGDPAEPERFYRQAIDVDPNHADAHFYLGRLLVAAGRKADAVAVFKKGQALEPRHGHKQPDDFADELLDLTD